MRVYHRLIKKNLPRGANQLLWALPSFLWFLLLFDNLIATAGPLVQLKAGGGGGGGPQSLSRAEATSTAHFAHADSRCTSSLAWLSVSTTAWLWMDGPRASSIKRHWQTHQFPVVVARFEENQTGKGLQGWGWVFKEALLALFFSFFFFGGGGCFVLCS